jgi:hypothetical protein
MDAADLRVPDEQPDERPEPEAYTAWAGPELYDVEPSAKPPADPTLKAGPLTGLSWAVTADGRGRRIDPPTPTPAPAPASVPTRVPPVVRKEADRYPIFDLTVDWRFGVGEDQGRAAVEKRLRAGWSELVEALERGGIEYLDVDQRYYGPSPLALGVWCENRLTLHSLGGIKPRQEALDDLHKGMWAAIANVLTAPDDGGRLGKGAVRAWELVARWRYGTPTLHPGELARRGLLAPPALRLGYALHPDEAPAGWVAGSGLPGEAPAEEAAPMELDEAPLAR